ncbi:MAG: hypothetical protein IT521_07030 [Burkholderiales bacterium]|nr:hypothetical protein [Burkholderiales bacterium]
MPDDLTRDADLGALRRPILDRTVPYVVMPLEILVDRLGPALAVLARVLQHGANGAEHGDSAARLGKATHDRVAGRWEEVIEHPRIAPLRRAE